MDLGILVSNQGGIMTDKIKKELAKSELIIKDYRQGRGSFTAFQKALIDFRLMKQATGINVYSHRRA